MLTAQRRRVSTGRVCRVKTVRTRTTRKARTTVSRTRDCRAYGRIDLKSDSHLIVGRSPSASIQAIGSALRIVVILLLEGGMPSSKKWYNPSWRLRYADSGSDDQTKHHGVARGNPPHLPATG